ADAAALAQVGVVVRLDGGLVPPESVTPAMARVAIALEEKRLAAPFGVQINAARLRCSALRYKFSDLAFHEVRIIPEAGRFQQRPHGRIENANTTTHIRAADPPAARRDRPHRGLTPRIHNAFERLAPLLIILEHVVARACG